MNYDEVWKEFWRYQYNDLLCQNKIQIYFLFVILLALIDRLCGLVVRVLGYRSRGPGSIPGSTRKKKVVGLERGPLSLVSATEELLDRKVVGSCLENREYGRRDSSRRPRGTLYPQKLAITSPTSGGRSVGIVRSRTQTMEFFFIGVDFHLLLMQIL
jgi:hypothetical protein